MANSTSSPSPSSHDDNFLSVPDGGMPKRRRQSWRQEIFNRVVTPSRHPNTPTVQGNYKDYDCLYGTIRNFDILE